MLIKPIPPSPQWLNNALRPYPMNPKYIEDKRVQNSCVMSQSDNK